MPTRITHYDQGDVWTPQATFKVGGVATDPTTVTVRVLDPSGVTSTVGPVAGATGGSGITRVSAGVYTYNVALNDAGHWFARFEGTGAAAGTVETQADVDPSQFYENAQLDARALVTVADAKDWLNRLSVETGDDLELARVINDLSDRIHEEAEREFKVSGTNPQTRVFEIEYRPRTRRVYVDGDYFGSLDRRNRVVEIGDLATITSVQIFDTDWVSIVESVDLADVTALPMQRKSWEPITSLLFNTGVAALSPGMRVSVTGNWGFPAVPGTIRQAVLDAVAWALDRDVNHYQQDLAPVGQQGGAGGNVIMVGGGGQRILSLPPVVLAAAWSFRHPGLG